MSATLSIVAVITVDGVLIPIELAESEWSYNLNAIWKEIDWNPWAWFSEHGENVLITREVVQTLTSMFDAVLALPDLTRDRLDTEGGLWAATPINAARKLYWLLSWAVHQDALYIKRGLH